MDPKSNTFSELFVVLNTIRSLYRQLYDLELSKRELLLKRDGTKLQQLLRAQEDLLREINRLESACEILLQELSRHYQIEISRLSQLESLTQINSRIRQKLSALRLELQELAVSLDNCARGNEAIIKDNMHFFRHMIEFLRESSPTYGPGEQNRTALIIDAAV
ncbi:MAG: flagellar protein FlgN [Leptospiraceae bacterium]|nr:flagellar protein FlgN [Leptospiraceae bacterium]MDW8307348.1 flagellar export chaperone FlgN [Leptospiraceae bacterium]